jgi:quercetin dioxygenase-like cupin family protein
MSRPLTITPHETVTPRSDTPESLVLEAEWRPGGAAPPPHFHPTQDEVFALHSGRLTVKLDGEERELAAGATLEIPHGTAHAMWNPDPLEPARATWTVQRPGRTLAWFEAIDALYREGRVGRNGRPGLLAFGVLLSEYDDVFRLAGVPRPAAKAIFGGLGAIGRRRGYRATAVA